MSGSFWLSRKRFWTVFFLAGLCGCSILNPPVFTSQELQGVATDIDPSAIVRDYRELVGQKVLVGGTVDQVKNESDRGFLRVNLFPLNDDMRPVKSMAPSGLILLRFDGPLNGYSLLSGQRVTAIGKVMAMRRPVEDGDHLLRLVVIDVGSENHLHTWPTRDQQTQGIGSTTNSNPGMMPSPGFGPH